MRAKALIPLFVMATAILAVACDAGFGVTGIVHEWPDPPIGAEGEIYVNEGEPVAGAVKGVVGASLSFGRYGKAVTDYTGAFKGFWVVGPGQYYVALTVEKEGYFTVSKRFRYDSRSPNYTFEVVMVRKQP